MLEFDVAAGNAFFEVITKELLEGFGVEFFAGGEGGFVAGAFGFE